RHRVEKVSLGQLQAAWHHYPNIPLPSKGKVSPLYQVLIRPFYREQSHLRHGVGHLAPVEIRFIVSSAINIVSHSVERGRICTVGQRIDVSSNRRGYNLVSSLPVRLIEGPVRIVEHCTIGVRRCRTRRQIRNSRTNRGCDHSVLTTTWRYKIAIGIVVGGPVIDD